MLDQKFNDIFEMTVPNDWRIKCDNCLHQELKNVEKKIRLKLKQHTIFICHSSKGDITNQERCFILNPYKPKAHKVKSTYGKINKELIENMAYVKQEGGSYWNAEKKGDTLEGKVTAKSDGEYGIQYTIETKDGEFVTPSHKVLQNRMVKANIGDKVKIVYTHEELPTTKGYKPTKMYEVFIDDGA